MLSLLQVRKFFGWKILNTSYRPVKFAVNTNAAFEASCALHSRTTYLALGVKNDDKGLRLLGMFNEALASMRPDRKL